MAFAGTPQAAVPALRALLEAARHDVVAVITRPRARAGRGRRETVGPIEQEAVAAGLPVLAPRRLGEPEVLQQLRDLDVDCCAVVAYGALVPPLALAIPKYGWVNVHFSVLPAWRGAAPVQHAVLHGDDVTGASTFQLDPGLDTGPVFGVVTEPVRPWDTAGDLLDRLAHSGATLLVATLDGLEDGTVQPRPQPTDGISLAPKITIDDARIDWTAPAVHVDRLIRACTPTPGAWTTFREHRIKLGPVRVLDETLPAGELAVTARAVAVGTATRAVELRSVQPPGRTGMAAADWARGIRPTGGERLG